MQTIELRGAAEGLLCADFYAPESQTPAPLIIAASGGGWRRGGRADLAQWGHFFAEKGFAFASIDYQRATSAPAFPQNVEDVVFAANALIADAEALQFDVKRVGLLGVSAGAHLTSLALLSNAYQMPALRGFAGIYGPYDVFAHWQEDLVKATSRSDNLTERMIGCGPFDDPDLYHKASPSRLITSAKALPIFLSWGKLDPAIAPEQSEKFAAALQQAGFPVRSRVFPDAGHFWFSEEDLKDPTTHASRVSADLLRFFRRIFGNPQ